MLSDDEFRDEVFLRVIADSLKMHAQARQGLATPTQAAVNVQIDVMGALRFAWSVAVDSTNARTSVRAALVREAEPALKIVGE